VKLGLFEVTRSWASRAHQNRPLVSPRRICLTNAADLAGLAKFSQKLLFALVQVLQPQMPAVKLNVELIDVTLHFCPLRFVLGQAAL